MVKSPLQQAFLKKYQKFLFMTVGKGEADLTLGDKENAIKYYKLAVELNPGDTDFAKKVLQNSKNKLQELGVKK